MGGAKTGDGLTRIMKRIRDLERVLKRPVPMDEQKRIELERAVAAYKVQAEDIIGDRKNKKNVEKYRMIRFFERQKASRKVKQARKLVEQADSDAKKKDAEALVVKYMADLAYTILWARLLPRPTSTRPWFTLSLSLKSWRQLDRTSLLVLSDGSMPTMM